MTSNDLITLVIHTPERALKLQTVLEAHNIHVELHKIEIDSLEFEKKPFEIKIKTEDLKQSLKILESAEFVTSPVSLAKIDNMSHTLLIPVDFSPASMIAVKVGFYLAKKFDVEPVLLHSFLAPQLIQPDFYENQIDPVEMPDFSEIEQEVNLEKGAGAQLSKFKKEIEIAQSKGLVTDIKFSTTLLEGIPEQVILEYTRQNKPVLVVMATRGIDKKESDLIGSVTAEVIDSCRVPILTVPDNYTPSGVEGLKKIVIFCNFSGYDAITIRALMRTFNFPSCEIWLVPAHESNFKTDIDSRLDTLCKYFAEIYPTAVFHKARLGKGKFDENMRKLIDENNINLIIVPNKKSNALNRFFHPTLAHKILFERDIPLLVHPVDK